MLILDSLKVKVRIKYNKSKPDFRKKVGFFVFEFFEILENAPEYKIKCPGGGMEDTPS